MNVVYTDRENIRRVISLRKANKREVKNMPMLKENIIIPTDEENAAINTGIDADKDTYELTTAEFATLKPMGRPKSSTHKKPISIRLSPEVVNYFKDTGKGWQTRVDEVLKDYVAHH